MRVTALPSLSPYLFLPQCLPGPSLASLSPAQLKHLQKVAQELLVPYTRWHVQNVRGCSPPWPAQALAKGAAQTGHAVHCVFPPLIYNVQSEEL